MDSLLQEATVFAQFVKGWLKDNADWIGSLEALVALLVAIGAFFIWLFKKKSAEGSGNTFDGGSGGTTVNAPVVQVGPSGTAAVHTRDPQDVETIKALQATIDKLVDRVPVADQQTNDQIREVISDAVTGLHKTDSDLLDIERAEQALDDGDTELAKILYRADAEMKKQEGKVKLQDATASYRRLGALAFLDDTKEAFDAYLKAVDLWPEDIVAWNQLGRLYDRIGQLDNAIDAYGRVGNLASTTDDPEKWSAISLGNLGNVYRSRGDLDRAIELYEQSLAISEALGRLDGIANSYANLGIIYKTKGDLGRAIELHEKSLAINEALGRLGSMAMDYSNLGTVYRIMGDFDRAIKLYEQSLAIEKKLGHKEGIASDYTNLGIVYQIKGDLIRAEELYEKSLVIEKKLDRKEGIARQYGNLGNIHRERGNLDKAIEFYEQSLKINRELGRKEGMASDYGNMGIVHATRGDLDRAIGLYEQSLTINQELDRKDEMANDYINLGIVYRDQYDLERARKCWENSVVLFAQMGSPKEATVQEWINNLTLSDPNHLSPHL